MKEYVYMVNNKPFFYQYWPSIITIVIILIACIIILQMINNVENFESSVSIKSVHDAYKHDPAAYHNVCKGLSKKACTIGDGCVYLLGSKTNEKCVGGDIHGPTFLTKNGKPLEFDSYIYKEKCFGKCYPKKSN
jgi:hypothetical protein